MTELRHRVCCIDLLNAIQDGYIHEVVSGLYFIIHEGNCAVADGTPRILRCPFCGAYIETIKLDGGWDWQIKKENK